MVSIIEFIKQNNTNPYFIVTTLLIMVGLFFLIRWIIIILSKPAKQARLIIKNVKDKQRYSGRKTVHLKTLAQFNGYANRADREVKRECQNIYNGLRHNGKIFDAGEELLDECYDSIENAIFKKGVERYLDRKYSVLKELCPVDFTLYWDYTSPKGKSFHEKGRKYSFNLIKDYCHEKEIRSLSDDMTSEEFEDYVQEVLKRKGIDAKTTSVSNDYGADLIFTYENEKFCVQCKCYSKSVGVKAVQEVIGSLPYYHADVGIVVTNNSFTKQAQKLATANNILLVEGKDIDNFPDIIAKRYY